MTYKFRGKVIGSYQWVYGNLLNRVDSIGPLTLIEVQDKETFEIEIFQVKPETVGMWTGMKDKNGKEVYESDLYSTEECGPNYKVMFVAGAFVGGTSEHPDDCMPLGWDVNEDVIEPDLPNWFEIIGNIHDDPHLLNPPADSPVINTMNNFNSNDPGTQQAEEVKAAGQEIAAVESEAQENAMESEEEGGAEG